jgi:hypothetical protein
VGDGTQEHASADLDIRSFVYRSVMLVDMDFFSSYYLCGGRLALRWLLLCCCSSAVAGRKDGESGSVLEGHGGGGRGGLRGIYGWVTPRWGPSESYVGPAR